LAIAAMAAMGAAAIHAQSMGGAPGQGGGGGGGGSPPPVNTCASLGNQLDFSDSTGCNLIWGGH